MNHSHDPKALKTQRGFTLVELAIVLVIVTLLTGGLLMTVSTQVEQRSRNETLQQLQDVRDALLGYAATHSATDGRPYLPCPDTDLNGIEEARVAGACPSNEGLLPWSDLGLGAQDAWSNRLRYRVDPGFSNSVNGFFLGKPATLRVCDQASCTSTVATGLPLVVLSHGRNGNGSTSSGNIANPAPNGADEIENTDNDNNFVSHTPTPPGANEFDDLVIWLSPNILHNRLIAAGRLP